MGLIGNVIVIGLLVVGGYYAWPYAKVGFEKLKDSVSNAKDCMEDATHQGQDIKEGTPPPQNATTPTNQPC